MSGCAVDRSEKREKVSASRACSAGLEANEDQLAPCCRAEPASRRRGGGVGRRGDKTMSGEGEVGEEWGQVPRWRGEVSEGGEVRRLR